MNWDDGQKEPWHVQKGIPLALMLTILVQTVLLGIAWGVMWNRVEANTAWIADNKRIDSRLAVLESKLTSIDETLRRLLAQNDRDQR